jgi:hypothetical protein
MRSEKPPTSTFVRAMTVFERGEGAADLGDEIGQPSYEAIEAFLLGAERSDDSDLAPSPRSRNAM